MLILQRKRGEAVVLNGNIKVTVLESGVDGVKLAIEAPKEVTVLREELLEAAKVNKEAAAGMDKLDKLKHMKKLF